MSGASTRLMPISILMMTFRCYKNLGSSRLWDMMLSDNHLSFSRMASKSAPLEETETESTWSTSDERHANKSSFKFKWKNNQLDWRMFFILLTLHFHSLFHGLGCIAWGFFLSSRVLPCDLDILSQPVFAYALVLTAGTLSRDSRTTSTLSYWCQFATRLTSYSR